MSDSNGARSGQHNQLALAQQQAFEPLAIQQTNPFLPQTWQQAIDIATVLSRAQLVPDAYRNKPNDIVLAMMRGHELGLSPIQSLTYFDVIKGKVAMSAQMIVALCLSKRHLCKYFIPVKSTETEAVFETFRVGTPKPVQGSFTMEDAKRMDLASKDNWRKQPKVMLRWRAATALGRLVYPDLVAGMYDPEELQPDVLIDDERLRAELARDVTPDAAQQTKANPPPARDDGWELTYLERIPNATAEELDLFAIELKPKNLGKDHPLVRLALQRREALKAQEKKIIVERHDEEPASPEDVKREYDAEMATQAET